MACLELTLKVLEGLTFTNVEDKADQLWFTCTDGRQFVFYHMQECYESVTIEDTYGDLADLINTPILLAEERTSEEPENGQVISKDQNSNTWTYYTFRTIKGTVTIRWYGESNGYYSETVDFMQYSEENKWRLS